MKDRNQFINNPKEKLIIALDFNSMNEATKLIDELGEEAIFYKVGLELFLYTKGEIIEYLASKNKKVFLDLKFHDIPNTTAMASLFAAKQNIFMFNVHTSGGKRMMEKTVEEIKKINKNNLIIGVTVLTSLSENDIKNMFSSNLALKDLAVNWAKLGKEAGLDGVVCSPKEANIIKKECGENFITVCPGVRPKWADINDQERTMTPKKAIENGCDYIVVGRPITRSDNRVKACKMIIEEIAEGIENNKNLKSVLIAEALLETNAVQLNIKNPFIFVSGIKSPIYCDNRLTLTAPDVRNNIENSLAEIIRTDYPEAEVLMGTSTAGIAHAAITGHILGLPMGYVRSSAKDHGRGNQIEGKLEAGQKVVVVEDLISTGGSAIEVVEALRGIVSIFTYGMQKSIDRLADAKVKNISLTDFDTVVHVAAEKNIIKPGDIARLIAFRNNPSDISWINGGNN